MYTTVDSFLTDWRQERLGTLKILRNLSDSALSQRVTPDGRSLGFLAWHIVLTLGEMGARAGLTFTAPPEDAPLPASAIEIARTYDHASAALADAVKTQWSDASLSEEVNMYGEQWKRTAVLLALVRHEIHHRAQMTVLMRQAGLKVPGLYGPAKEEWAQMGMPPQS